jgi:hypothetical protein
MGGEALGEGGGQVGGGSGVGQGRVLAAGQLDRGGQRPWPAYLDLERSGVAVRDLRQGIEVGGEEPACPAEVTSGPAGEPPAGRGQLDRQVDEERGGAAGQVGAGPRAGSSVR